MTGTNLSVGSPSSLSFTDRVLGFIFPVSEKKDNDKKVNRAVLNIFSKQLVQNLTRIFLFRVFTGPINTADRIFALFLLVIMDLEMMKKDGNEKVNRGDPEQSLSNLFCESLIKQFIDDKVKKISKAIQEFSKQIEKFVQKVGSQLQQGLTSIVCRESTGSISVADGVFALFLLTYIGGIL